MSTSYDICAQPIPVEELERRMQVFHDTGKVHGYSKHTGKWGWCDRDVMNDLDNWHDGFDTFWEAILDATDPYFEEDGEDE